MSTRPAFIVLVIIALAVSIVFTFALLKVEAVVHELIDRHNAKQEALQRIELRKEIWRQQELDEMNRDWIGAPWVYGGDGDA